MPLQSIMPLTLTYLSDQKIPRAYAIERTCQAEPWDPDSFERTLRHKSVIGTVAEHRGKVVGYMVYGFREHQIELLRIGVLPAQQRRGVGSEMVARLLTKLRPDERPQICTIVPEESLGVQLFLRRWGFRATSIAAHHFGDDQNGYRFGYDLRVAEIIEERHIRGEC